MSSKITQRQALTQQRSAVSEATQVAASQQVVAQLLKWPPFVAAMTIGLYQACHCEISLEGVWQAALKAGKRCYFPKMLSEHTLCFLPADATTRWTKNAYGILEPQGAVLDAAATLDVLLLPLVGFDARGHRLGRGEGWYDRWLATHAVGCCVGVGYAFQQVPEIKADAWDETLDWIVTERAIVKREL